MDCKRKNYQWMVIQDKAQRKFQDQMNNHCDSLSLKFTTPPWAHQQWVSSIYCYKIKNNEWTDELYNVLMTMKDQMNN